MCPISTWSVCLATPVPQTYGNCRPLRSEVKSLGNLKACTEITRSVHQRLLERKHERLPLKLYKTANYFKNIFKPPDILSYNKSIFIQNYSLKHSFQEMSTIAFFMPPISHLKTSNIHFISITKIFISLERINYLIPLNSSFRSL